MSNSFTSMDADGTMSNIEITKQGKSSVVEVTTTSPNETPSKPAKKKVDLKKIPHQSEDTPKTKRRYYYAKTGNYVSYARAKQLGLVD